MYKAELNKNISKTELKCHQELNLVIVLVSTILVLHAMIQLKIVCSRIWVSLSRFGVSFRMSELAEGSFGKENLQVCG